LEGGRPVVVDNLPNGDGRGAFEGSRQVLVAMADAVHLADCSPTIEVTGG